MIITCGTRQGWCCWCFRCVFLAHVIANTSLEQVIATNTHHLVISMEHEDVFNMTEQLVDSLEETEGQLCGRVIGRTCMKKSDCQRGTSEAKH